MSSDSEQLEIDFGKVNADYSLSSGVDSITLDTSWLDTTTITLPSLDYNTSHTMASSYVWAANDNYTISGSNGYSNTAVKIDESGLDLKAGCDIKVGGRSLTEAIDKIEERLGILHPNPELEDRWQQLKDLRNQYQELEKELLEKEKMWKILKEN
jgi:hypothetical protein